VDECDTFLTRKSWQANVEIGITKSLGWFPAKLPRSHLRRLRAAPGSKGRSRAKKISVRQVPKTFPLELRAPITAHVERQLKQLVAQFGEKQVLEALDPLVTKCKWNDWQCVANAIRRIAREK
jgi:hypothetical protein